MELIELISQDWFDEFDLINMIWWKLFYKNDEISNLIWLNWLGKNDLIKWNEIDTVKVMKLIW